MSTDWSPKPPVIQYFRFHHWDQTKLCMSPNRVFRQAKLCMHLLSTEHTKQPFRCFQSLGCWRMRNYFNLFRFRRLPYSNRQKYIPCGQICFHSDFAPLHIQTPDYPYYRKYFRCRQILRYSPRQPNERKALCLKFYPKFLHSLNRHCNTWFRYLQSQ